MTAPTGTGRRPTGGPTSPADGSPAPADGSPAPTGGLVVTGVRKTFDTTTAVAGVSFSVARGEVVALLGPSGCGKSTLLHLVAGLHEPDGGQITWDGAPLAGVPPHRRGFGLMFQDYVLFPHLNVQDNVAFGLRMAGRSRPARERRTQELLTLVGLAGFGPRAVDTLSGGEQQRVALARALAPSPRLLMLDEPLGALDRTLRQELLDELRRLLTSLRQTALYVTHDQEEAFALADRVVLLAAGQVVQVGSPWALYHQPANAFAARFLGLKNLLPGQARQAGGDWVADTALGPLPLPRAAAGPVTVLVRPDEARLQAGDGGWPLSGVLVERTFRGRLTRVLLQAGETRLTFELPSSADLPPVGASLTLWLDAANGVQIVDEAEDNNPGYILPRPPGPRPEVVPLGAHSEVGGPPS